MSIPDDLTGFFWRPEEPDLKIAGHLLSAAELRLELHGCFDGFDGIVGSTSYPILLGVGEGSQQLTLYRCFTSGAQLGGFVQQRLSISLAFVGAHFTEDELVFTEIQFATDHLADWAAHSDIVHTQPPPEGFRWQVGLRKPGTVAADLGDGQIVKIFYEGGLHNRRGSVELSESPVAIGSVETAMGHRDLLSTYLFPLRDLLTFATGSPARLDNVTLRGPHAVHTLSSGTSHKRDIELRHALLQPRDEDRAADRLPPQRMVFALGDWHLEFSELIRQWLALMGKHESSMNLLMGLLYAPPRWEATRVLTLAQALEAYHRTAFPDSPANVAAAARKARALRAVESTLDSNDRGWLKQRLELAEEPALWKRIREVTARVAPILDPLIPEIDNFASDLAKVRHTYSHFGAGGSSGEAARRDYSLGRSAYWVLVTNYLLDLGFTTELARTLITRNQHFQLDLKPEWIET